MSDFFSEGMLTVLLATIGYLYIPKTFRRTPFLQLTLSFPVGCTVTCLASVASLVVFNRFFPIPTLIALFAGGLLFASSSRDITIIRSDAKILIAAVAPAYLALSFAFRAAAATVMTYDSFHLLLSSWVLESSSTTDLLREKLLNYPVFVQVIFSIAKSWDIELYHSFGPVILTSALTSAAVIAVPAKAWKSPLLILTVVCCLLTIFSNWMGLLQVFYINGHTATAGYLALAIFAIRELRVDSVSARWILVPFSLMSIVLLRLEGPLLVALMLCSLPYTSAPPKRIYAMTLPPIILAAFWYGSFVLSAGNDSILSGTKLAGMIGLMAAPALVYSIPKFRRLSEFFQPLCLASLVVVMLTSFFIAPEHMAKSASSMFVNATLLNLWGMTWFALWSVSFILFCFFSLKEKGTMLFNVSAITVALVILGFLRKDLPFRIGWGDSGNRMMFHLMPTFAMIILLFVAANITDERSQPS